MSGQPPAQLFPDEQWQQLLVQLDTLTEQQRFWLSGYLTAGVAIQAPQAEALSSGVTIAYGTETDNCRHIAAKLASLCQEMNIDAEVVDMAQLRVRKLSKLDYLVVIIATHGDGDPPEPVTNFYDELMAESAPKLIGLRFAVLALGDSSYEQFCVTGQRVDQRLEALGGKRLIPRRDCDVDFEQSAHTWMTELVTLLPREEATSFLAFPTTGKATAQTEYSKSRPALVEVLANHNLSDPGRVQPIHHLELALPDTGFVVEPGDAIGVLPENPPELVATILDMAGISGDQPVTVDNNAQPLVEALRRHRDLVIPGQGFIDLWASLSGSDELVAICEGDSKTRRAFLQSHQIRDLMSVYPARPQPQTLVYALRPLQPRLYDVANSLNVVDDELHLTVKDYHYPFRGREEHGIASRFLLELQPGDRVAIYPHRNTRFRLPENPSVPLILVADGTGIAPYRAFLQALSHQRTTPLCWLVFAEHSFEQDFLYQLDVQLATSSGVLDCLDTVFYSDQPDAALADPLLNREGQLTDWLEREGHIYMCGDKSRLEQCEFRLEHRVDELCGQGYWKALSKARRVHRNLY